MFDGVGIFHTARVSRGTTFDLLLGVRAYEIRHVCSTTGNGEGRERLTDEVARVFGKTAFEPEKSEDAACVGEVCVIRRDGW